eukprot:jgi/Chlat1/462/Chrsp103S01071
MEVEATAGATAQVFAQVREQRAALRARFERRRQQLGVQLPVGTSGGGGGEKAERKQLTPATTTTPEAASGRVREVKQEPAAELRGAHGPDGFVPHQDNLYTLVAHCLLDPDTVVPVDSVGLHRRLSRGPAAQEYSRQLAAAGLHGVEPVLADMARDGCIELEEFLAGGAPRLMVLDVERNRLAALVQTQEGGAAGTRMHHFPDGPLSPNHRGRPLPPPPPPNLPHLGPGFGRGRGFVPGMLPGMGPGMMGPGPFLGPGMPPGLPMFRPPGAMHRPKKDNLDDIEMLLGKPSFKEKQQTRAGEELKELLSKPTARETAVAAKFKSKGGSALQEYCPYLTKEDCRNAHGSFLACEKLHFCRIIQPHTDLMLGDCSFLDTCRHMKTCRFVHYELDPTPDLPLHPFPHGAKKRGAEYLAPGELGHPQWVNCDVRTFDMTILGKFGIIMADPPWDIHMELPYGTMADDEMRSLNIQCLQDDGLIFLWVTGRAMELGRECLELWGYKRVEELIWVKTNQLQRIIRTGRTGHWLNHSKEHCIIGIKGNPEINRNIDCDVLVAEVRETSRKPDEMYGLLERLSPRTRKLEIFARMHNTHPGWVSLGNQLDGVHLVDEEIRQRYAARFPDVMIDPPVLPSLQASDAGDMSRRGVGDALKGSPQTSTVAASS